MDPIKIINDVGGFDVLTMHPMKERVFTAAFQFKKKAPDSEFDFPTLNYSKNTQKVTNDLLN